MIGGRRTWREVRRSLALSTVHKIEIREFRRLRKAIPKLGNLLTMLGTRCNDGLVVMRISAAALVKFDAAAAARDDLGD